MFTEKQVKNHSDIPFHTHKIGQDFKAGNIKYWQRYVPTGLHMFKDKTENLANDLNFFTHPAILMVCML